MLYDQELVSERDGSIAPVRRAPKGQSEPADAR